MGESRKESKKIRNLKAGQALSGRILVAEDDRSTQHLISDFLELMGLEVSLADNGIEALDLFIRGCFDMVLTDFQMPLMDGFTLANHIKKRSPNTPVILLTGARREEVLMKVKKGPFYSVIFKPFKMADLQRDIQGALAFIAGFYKNSSSNVRESSIGYLMIPGQGD